MPSTARTTTRGVALNSTLIVVAQSTQAIAIGAIALFLPLIRAQFGLTFTQAGMLAAAATLTYAVMQIPAGVIADRYSPKLVFSIGILGTNLLAIAFALSDSFVVMLVTQAVGGVFRALMFIPGMVLITRHFSHARRATALGLFVAGGFSSNIVVNLAGPLLVEPLGWQGVILLSSALGLVVLGAFWLLADDGPPHAAGAHRPSRWVWRTAAWWLLGVIQFSRLWIVAGFAFWLPAFLVEDRGFAIAAAGLVVAVSSTISAPSNIGGGILSDRLGRPLLVIGVSLAAMSILFGVLGFVESTWGMLVILAVLAVFVQLYFGPLFAVPTRLFGPGLAGLSGGFGNFCANTGGFASVLMLGLLRDATGSFTPGFLTLAAAAIIGLAALLILSRLGSPSPND